MQTNPVSMHLIQIGFTNYIILYWLTTSLLSVDRHVLPLCSLIIGAVVEKFYFPKCMLTEIDCAMLYYEKIVCAASLVMKIAT